MKMIYSKEKMAIRAINLPEVERKERLEREITRIKQFNRGEKRLSGVSKWP